MKEKNKSENNEIIDNDLDGRKNRKKLGKN